MQLSQLGHDVQNWSVTVVHAVNVSTTRRRVELSWIELCRYKRALIQLGVRRAGLLVSSPIHEVFYSSYKAKYCVTWTVTAGVANTPPPAMKTTMVDADYFNDAGSTSRLFVCLISITLHATASLSSFCPSICLSHSCIVPKRLNISSNVFTIRAIAV